MTGDVVGPLTINIGKGKYSEEVIVAQIEEEMLLGLDFMLKWGLDIKLLKAEISIGMESIPLVMETNPEPTISRVTVVKRSIIPPNSVRLVPCQLWFGAQYMLEPHQYVPGMIPRVMYPGTDPPRIYTGEPIMQ